MKKLKKILLSTATFIAVFLFMSISASANTLGGDFASYQDSTPTYMQQYKNRGMKFSIVKLGGRGGNEGYHYQNPKASAQLASASKVGMKVGGYFWGQFGGNASEARYSAQLSVQDAKRVGLKKGSVIALDYEAGATYNKRANTNAIVTYMNYIKNSGYKPALYTGSSYLTNYININTIGHNFGTCIWIANYKTMSLQTAPDFNWFPSFPYIAMWQFGSNWYGIDGSVDLVNFMSKGDVKDNTPVKPVTPNRSNQTNTRNTTYKVVYGDSWWSIAKRVGLDMHTLAKLNGKTINSVIYPGETLKIKGTIKNNAKKQHTNVSQGNSKAQYIVKSGDSWWKIARNHSMNMYKLASLNGKSINSTIYPGQRIKVSGSSVQSSSNTGRYRIVQRGDSLSRISYLTGYSINYLANKNGIRNINSIYPGQRIYY